MRLNKEMIPVRRYLALFSAASFATAVCGWAAPDALASNLIFWTNVANNTITYANLDGSGGFGTLDTSPVTPSLPEGVAMDPANGKIYWANETGSIMFANLSGGGGGVLNTSGATVDWPFGVALDPAHGKIYWANSGASSPGTRISWANLDGSGGGNLNTGRATVDGPIGVTIDPAAGKIYWSNWSANVISFAFLDGSGGGDLNATGASVNHPEGGAIDPTTGRFFFSDERGTAISFANLARVGGGDLATGPATVNVPSGVAIDPFAGKIYWANQNGGALSSANLDGSGGADLDVSGSPSTNASMPALLKAPRATGAPGISAGISSPSMLSCSEGSWAPDLNAQQLYQAPQSFAYSWSMNGNPIPGAGARSITATTPGDYTCTVTASNRAGSTSQTSPGYVVSPPEVSVRIHTRGPVAWLTFTCKGLPGQTCAGTFLATGHKHALGGVAIAVTARKIKHRSKRRHRTKGQHPSKTGSHKPAVALVVLGRGSYRVPAGRTVTGTFTLNAAGKRLLARLFAVHGTLTLTPTSGAAIRPLKVTFSKPRHAPRRRR